MNQLSALLTNATHPITYPSRPTTRARARGQGHRRRVSQIPASRASAYETIQEEVGNGSAPSSPAPPVKVRINDTDFNAEDLKKSQVASEAYSSPEPQVEIVSWDDHENGVVLRRWFAFRNEAHETLEESKRVWEDTPFSVFAVQSAFALFLYIDILILTVCM